jgi:hypothetical protein
MITRTLSAALLLIGIGGTPLQAACPGGVSSYFNVSGEVTNRAVFDLNKLEQFAPAQENVTYFAAGSVVTESFTGVLLWDLLNNAPVNGIVTEPAIKNDILHKVIIVTGTDCYQSVFGAGEVDPFFGGNPRSWSPMPLADSRSAALVLRGSLLPATRPAADLSRTSPASRYGTPPPTIRQGYGLARAGGVRSNGTTAPVGLLAIS